MANLPENAAAWPTGVYQIEATDPVVGGLPDEDTGAGMSNIPHKQLADRTAWLKAMLDDLLGVALTTDNSPRLLAQNGYFRLGAGGLMIQWGRADLAASVNLISFPTPFTTACFGVLASDMATGVDPAAAHAITVVNTITKTQFSAYARRPASNTEFGTTPIFFVALGH